MPLPPIEFEPSSSYEDAIARAAAECGVERGYWDIFHQRHEASAEVLRRILETLGMDVSSWEAVEQSRKERFRREYIAFPQTVVIGESEKWAPLTTPEGASGSIRYELVLESGQAVGGEIDLDQLPREREVHMEGRCFVTRRLLLPAETPLGYHKLKIGIDGRAAGECYLIVCPDRAYLPEQLTNGRAAGFNLSLYGVRSSRNWGCGDFTDLHPLIDWAQETGFAFIGLNPLHVLHNRVPYNTSPYLPLSIFYKNPIYLDIEEIAEFRASTCAQRLGESPRIRGLIRKLRDAEFVEYEQVDRLKRCFLKVLYRQFRRGADAGRRQAFAAYCRREGDLLSKFALYRALDEALHKQDRNRWTWWDWPKEYQSPDSPACRRFGREHARLIEFYQYTQFAIDEQLAAAQAYARERGMSAGLYHDLAVATDRCGSDLWAHRKFYVNGCRVGAPPDDFSPEGQDWSFPPPNPEMHRDTGYVLYREGIRKIVEHGGALRIDHVMRLFRLFWIPEGSPPKDGAYVRDHAVYLMRILALESVRSRNVIIGEDLGTVTDEIREMLSRFGILSYRLFYFEKHYPNPAFKHSYEYPRPALVSSSTHDLPTIAGFWTNRDIEARKAAGLADEQGYWRQIEERKREKQRLLDLLHSENLLPYSYPRNAAEVGQVDGDLHNAIIGFLAQTASTLLLLNQEDLTKETEQQNLPGSTAQYPNWRRKMRVAVEELNTPEWQPYAAMFRDQLARTGRRS
ncbi:MAG: 4-alpha-glucanotransferase [Bryobacteraceae bacterium]